ncbi:hypothetical protein [Micrococcus sp.]|uniref:hypothetical protein n=1 Tax=Micrococcus sp. TaxID=1271 RepID=UPI002A918AF9|nr:hypothetical protein [Micrococcus sp.]MDY6054365.1 hypothetical protein [Micrococcus sp.]
MTGQQHTQGTATVHGQTIPLTPIDDGEIVTDVIVIVRTLKFDENDRAHDFVYVDQTRSTTEIVTTGMLTAAEQVAMGYWEPEDEDED